MLEKYEDLSIFHFDTLSLPYLPTQCPTQSLPSLPRIICKDCGLTKKQNGGSEMSSTSVDKSSFINEDFNKANSSANKFIFK